MEIYKFYTQCHVINVFLLQKCTIYGAFAEKNALCSRCGSICVICNILIHSIAQCYSEMTKYCTLDTKCCIVILCDNRCFI